MVVQESEQLNHPEHRRNKMQSTKDAETKMKKKEKIEAKPLPVDKEKAREIEQGKTNQSLSPEKSQEQSKSTSPSTEDSKTPQPKKEISDDNKKEDKKETKKKDEKPKVKKYEAVVHGRALPISTKTGKYICKFIIGREIDKAMEELNKVIAFKKPVPYKGEIPHRKGKIMSGRYPQKASKYFINLLKALKGNAIANGLELEKVRIAIASANVAARPMKSRSREAKRTHITLKAKEFSEKKGGKK